MHFPFLHLITNDHRPQEQPGERPEVVAHEPQSISVEGSEFLDDALRMEDLPLRTEISVAVGSPANLL